MRSVKTLVAGGATLGLLALVVLTLAGPATATQEMVTLCHASGQEGTTKFETITVGYPAAYGPAGHFDENGTPNAGHEQDYLGECEEEPPPPVDVCPNLEGDQATVPDGYVLGEDENGRPACIPVPPPDDVCPNIEGDQEDVPEGMIIDENGDCVVPPPPDVCPNIEGAQSEVPAGMVLKDGQCVTPVPPDPFGNASVICLLPAGIYQLSGTVDGQAADSVTPATLPGSTKGVTNVVVTRGDTSVRTAVATLGDCGTTTTVTVIPPTVTPTAVPPTPPPPAAKPVVKPKPKAKPPVKRKTAVKAKPKPKPTKKPQKAPKTLSI